MSLSFLAVIYSGFIERERERESSLLAGDMTSRDAIRGAQ